MRDYKEKKWDAQKPISFHSKLVANDIRLKNLEHVAKIDKEKFNLGYQWFNNGLTLEDAEDTLRNDFNFVNGFKKAQRVKNINDELTSLGREWFESGLDLADAPANYVNNEYFVSGYEQAKSHTTGKGL